MAREDQEVFKDGKGNSIRVATAGIGRASLEEDDAEDEADEGDDGIKVPGDDLKLASFE